MIPSPYATVSDGQGIKSGRRFRKRGKVPLWRRYLHGAKQANQRAR